jgi:hypothetical protein
MVMARLTGAASAKSRMSACSTSSLSPSLVAFWLA